MSTWHAVRAVLRRPAAGVVLGCCLALQGCWLGIRGDIPGLESLSVRRPMVPYWHVIQRGDDLELVRRIPQTDEGERLRVVGDIRAWPVSHSSGFYADVLSHRGVRFISHGDFDVERAESLAVESIMTDDDPRIVELAALGPGGPVQTTLRWSGVIHNALAVLLTSALVASIALRRIGPALSAEGAQPSSEAAP